MAGKMGPNIFATVSEAHLEKIIRILPLLLPLLHSLPLLRGAGVLLEGVFHKRVKHVIQDTSGGKVSHIRVLSCTKKSSYKVIWDNFGKASGFAS